ncbi:MAG TPA: hypothetical protein GXZ24_01590 [Firmicutes bacterium]|jgi:predicted lipid-binding transport protein (Tim44 family)|nr:hypothetical protein [Bacillota bacterium]
MKDNITENDSGKGLEDIGDKLARLAQHLEKFNIAEYMNMLNNPRRYLFVNFLGGIFRGLGMALGLTIFGAFILYVLQRLVVLNLPLIGDFLAELVRIILTYL